MEPHSLSERQVAILQFVNNYISENGYPPTVREIGQAVGISSTSVVNYNLRRLEEKGLISRSPAISRGIRLTDEAQTYVSTHGGLSGVLPIPLAGRIVAGEPVPTYPYTGSDDVIEIPRDLVGDDAGLFALEVVGDSMIDAMINDGDIVIMKSQQVAEDGDMVAVWLTDREETTLKYFYREGDVIRLQPANPYMEPIYVDPANVTIQGKVMAVLRRVG